MRKMIVLFGFLVFAYAQVAIEREYDSAYQREVCGDDYECSANRDFIPNVSIKEAFEQDLQKEIQFPKYEKRVLIYKEILALGMPKESLNTTFVITMDNQDYEVEVIFIKSKNKLIVTYTIEVEESTKTYIKIPNGVEIFNHTSML